MRFSESVDGNWSSRDASGDVVLDEGCVYLVNLVALVKGVLGVFSPAFGCRSTTVLAF